MEHMYIYIYYVYILCINILYIYIYICVYFPGRAQRRTAQHPEPGGDLQGRAIGGAEERRSHDSS